MKAAIEAIPDGMHGSGQRSLVRKGPGVVSNQLDGKRGAIHIEVQGRGENYFTSTAETSKFRQVRGIKPHNGCEVYIAYRCRMK